MYSEAANVGVEVNRSVGSLSLLSARTSCKKERETSMPQCFGTSEVYFCGSMKCPRRKACQELVSPWDLEL
jgi:hypothetical protein